VAVEVDEVEFREAVEGVEEGEFGLILRTRCGAAQVFDEDSGVNLLLDIDRRCICDEVFAIQSVLALPHELRV